MLTRGLQKYTPNNCVWQSRRVKTLIKSSQKQRWQIKKAANFLSRQNPVCTRLARTGTAYCTKDLTRRLYRTICACFKHHHHIPLQLFNPSFKVIRALLWAAALVKLHDDISIWMPMWCPIVFICKLSIIYIDRYIDILFKSVGSIYGYSGATASTVLGWHILHISTILWGGNNHASACTKLYCKICDEEEMADNDHVQAPPYIFTWTVQYVVSVIRQSEDHWHKS